MPFDGSGNYIPAGAPNFPATPGNTIIASYYNNVINDIATALSLCITRDGQGKPSANIDWNGKNLTNIATFGCTGNATVGGNLAVTGNTTLTGTLTSGNITTGSVTASGNITTPQLILTVNFLARQYGGTGMDTSAAANGTLLIGNGAGMSLATLTAGANITITNSAGGITIAAAGGGGGGTTSFALTMNNGGAGAASGTTFNGGSAQTISYNTIGAAPITPQLQTVTSSATVTPTFSNDMVQITAQAVALTLANPTGTAVDGWGMVIRIKDNGGAQTIAYGTNYRAVGISLPTVTIAGKWLYLVMCYNATDTKWDVTGVMQQ